MNKTLIKAMHGKGTNLAKLTLKAGRRVGEKLTDEYTTLFRVADLLKAKVEPATVVSDWSPMSAPTKKVIEQLFEAIPKAEHVILNEVLNTGLNTNETIAVPTAFTKWDNGRKFHYEIDMKGRAKVNLSEVSEETVKAIKSGTIDA